MRRILPRAELESEDDRACLVPSRHGCPMNMNPCRPRNLLTHCCHHCPVSFVSPGLDSIGLDPGVPSLLVAEARFWMAMVVQR